MNIDCECQQKHKRPRCGCGVRIASVTIPASLGTSDPGQPNAPENGAYKNAVVRYQADGKVYIYTSEGIPVLLNDGTTGKVISVNGKTGEVVLTSEDVGALPSDTFIPVKVSDLINDSNFQTAQQVAATVAIETDARTAADANLSDRITANAEAITGEATARQGADVNLQNQIDALVASSDVKDIVGTYAELQQYDTSTLGDRDIIKVLQDETQQNATTYYRWSTSTHSFTLIGTEGPYYTRGEADTLLNAKADKSTTYTKTETDNLLATKADQDTTYTKTETDSLLATKANQNTTYTKTETDTLLATKANQSTTYTKAETDSLLATKADQDTTYTKTETNNLLATKADQSTTYTKTETDSRLATKADQSTTYTKTETDNLLAAKANQSTTYTKTETDTLLDGKQDVLTAGANVSISGNTISATDTTYTAGTNVSISGNVISATDTTYTAGTNVSISGNVISATDTTYTAGTGLNLTGTQFSVDTTTIAQKSDVPSIKRQTASSAYQDVSTLYVAGDGSTGAPMALRTHGDSTSGSYGYININEPTSTIPAAYVGGYVWDYPEEWWRKLPEVRLALYSDLPTIVQATGNSTTSIMSQKAVTDALASILASGTNAPTTSTVGEVGTLYAYVVSGTGHLAICTDTTGGTYTWQTLI